MNSEEIKKAYMTNDELGEAECNRINSLVSEFKRYLEVMVMIPGAEKAEKDNPEAFREKYRLSRDYREDGKMFLDPRLSSQFKSMSEEEYLSAVTETAFRYSQFLNNKFFYRDLFREKLCVPDNEVIKKWRERQIHRCLGLAGSASLGNIHVPLAIELSDGCSVGCKFCGIGAGKLKSVFRYTDENSKLFNDVLETMHDIIGDAAGSAMLYYCGEPLDNPDYKKFMSDFYKKSGLCPQITTAVALRDVLRTHDLLADLSQKPVTIYRFSVLSVDQAEKILDEFTPEELLRVELLPQYPEAKTFSGFVDAGKARDAKYHVDSGVYQSICCLSGFVINMSNMTVRMITSVPASDEYPTGEKIYEKKEFKSAEDLKTIVESMIDRYMVNELPKSRKLKFYDYVKVKDDSGDDCMLIAPGYHLKIKDIPGGAGKPAAEMLAKGDYTAKEIVSEITDSEKIDPVEVYRTLYYYWMEGVIDEFH